MGRELVEHAEQEGKAEEEEEEEVEYTTQISY
jgi:hypothetical protein